MTSMWYSNGMFHYMLKAEFVALVSLKVPSGTRLSGAEKKIYTTGIWENAFVFVIWESGELSGVGLCWQQKHFFCSLYTPPLPLLLLLQVTTSSPPDQTAMTAKFDL